MIQRRFYIAVLVRIALIIGVALVFAFNLYRHEKVFTLLASAAVIVLLGYDLVRITNWFNRHLSSFFEALKHEDHTFGMKKMHVPGYPVLSDYMDEINRKLTGVYMQHEQQAQFLDSIVEHIRIGLLAFKPNGNVVFFNKAACDILGLHRIGHINAIRERYPVFGERLDNLKPGAHKMIRLAVPQGVKYLALNAGCFISGEERIRLFSFQDIGSEVEETETETWKRLIRVLTHEINNSISPIFSLSGSMKQMIVNKPGNQSQDRSTARMYEGLSIIEERSRGLLDFVDRFRSLTPRGALNPESIRVEDLFYRVKILMQGQEEDLHGISLSSSVYPPSLTLQADKKLLEQMLINLVKNALEAVGRVEATRRGQITLRAFQDDGLIRVQVVDNGPGIPREELETIFVPFYTTKEEGSGIGLSLSRQIMRMHGGSVTVRSEPDKGAVFTLSFPRWEGREG